MIQFIAENDLEVCSISTITKRYENARTIICTLRAAAVILADAATDEKQGLNPMGRLVSYELAGVAPSIMGEGQIPTVKVALAVSRGLDFDPDKTNPNGGAVALGHPNGATGAILAVKAFYVLECTHGRYAMVTMCMVEVRELPLSSKYYKKEEIAGSWRLNFCRLGSCDSRKAVNLPMEARLQSPCPETPHRMHTFYKEF